MILPAFQNGDWDIPHALRIVLGVILHGARLLPKRRAELVG